MFANRRYSKSTTNKGQGVPSTGLLLLTAAGGVAVLFFSIAAYGTAGAEDVSGTSLSVFQFSCDFQFPVGRGRLDGLMVSDGSRYRIAVYWIEPDAFREAASFVRYSDFIFASEAVHYWIYPDRERGTFLLPNGRRDPLLPHQDSVESIIRSALATVSRIRIEDKGTDVSLEIGKFFCRGRTLTEYAYEALPSGTDSNDLYGVVDSDVRTLNTLPSGREYSKENRSDGAFVWRSRRALDGQPVATVIVKPAMGISERDWPAVFDANTLGRWALIPEPYRVYWSLDRAYSELGKSADESVASRELYGKIDSYLDDSDLPPQLRRGIHRLWFKTALATDDMNRIRRSAQAAVAEFYQDGSVGKYRALLELARVSGQVERRYPQQPQEWFRPLVAQMVEDAGDNIGDYLGELMPTIDANKWFMCGQLLLDEIRRRGLMEEQALEPAAVRFEATRLAREKRPPDPREARASIREYLARLDADPPRGEIDMNDLRQILEKGLAKHYADSQSETKRKVVDDVITSIRLIVGKGPFCGDPMALIGSIERFSHLYFAVDKTTEPIHTVLATFLSLSFCDISTAQDHDVLFSQFRRCSAELQSHVNTMLSERGLNPLITSEDVEGVFGQHERIFGTYADEPLWPTFRFPWTLNEQIRLASKLRLRLAQLEPLLDEVSLKVRYGGVSLELKQKVVWEISRTAEQLLAEAAFLRRPSYPGVSCQYRGGHGFTAVIKGPVYQESNRPKQIFRAMEYFHLGHRLEEVVEREREFAKSAREQELSQ